jgi:hypothetical protein
MSYTRLFDDSIYTSFQKVYDGLTYSNSSTTLKTSLPGFRIGGAVHDRKGKIAAGLQAGSSYSSDRQAIVKKEAGFATCTFLDSSLSPPVRTVVTVSGWALPPDAPVSLSMDTVGVGNRALVKILKSVREQHQQMNGSTFLGELGQTIRMLRRPAEALRKEVDRYFLSLENRKRKVLRLPPGKRRAEWEKALSGTWLEMQFGWKPLISDSKAIAETLARMLNEPPKVDRIRARAFQENAQSFIPFEIPVYGHFITGWLNRLRQHRFDVQYVVGLKSHRRAHASGIQRLIDVCGFNPEDFIPTLYEITPWSFLVDYFSNVGDIVEAAATNTSDVAWIVRTERHKIEELVTTSQGVSDPGWYWAGYKFQSQSHGHLGKYHSVRTVVNRTLPATLGIPTLQFTHPGESAGKMLNMLALLAQRRKGLQGLSGLPPPEKKERRFNELYAHL